MSKFLVSALKYRPRRFDDVVGQPHIVNTLRTAIETNQLAHAFLFCGPRGVGKTTCARILARVINCADLREGTNACGECPMCLAFDRQASFNIFELDAASNNSVDSIRSLTDQVRYAPQQGKYKVYIIDEVHMLSQAAFNAFLKTLEEPPAHAIFILATTEKHKIIPTILSRCQIFDFRRITVRDMVAHLGFISAQEGVTAEKDALVTIAQKSDGALRDALSLFDRLANASNKDLTYQSVVQNLNLLDYDVYFQVTDACLREDVRSVLLLYDKIMQDGFEGDAFLEGLGSHYRDLLVSRDPATLALQDHSAELKERYQRQASLLSPSYIFSALNLINNADLAYPQVRNKRLHVEMALARVCFLKRLQEGSPFTTEKKTADVTPSQPLMGESKPAETIKKKDVLQPQHASVSDAEAITELPEADPVVESLRKKTEQDPEPAAVRNGTDEPASAVVENSPAAVVSPPRKSKKIVNTPQLGSLFDLRSEIEKSEEAAKANSLTLSAENVAQWWERLCASIKSPSANASFKLASVTLDGKVLRLVVDSPLAKTHIQEEGNLLLQFREAFHDHSLEIDLIVEETEEMREARKPKKIRTNREKYEILVRKNPAMEELKTTLGLVVDQDE